MNIEKIQVNGHYVWVDKDEMIKTGDFFLSDNKIDKCLGTRIPNMASLTETRKIDICYKIIASSPELNLEGVPTYVDFICEQEAKKFHDKGKHEDWDIYNQLVYEDKEMIIVGYRLAEKELQKQLITEIMNEDAKDGLYEPQPTWDDLRKAIDMTFIGCQKGSYYNPNLKEEILEQLKQSK